MKISRVRATLIRPTAQAAAPASWMSESEVASPMSIYPRYKQRRSSWWPRWPDVLIRVDTDEGLTGIGGIAPAPVRPIVEDHFAYLLAGDDPTDIERLWDQMYRASLDYGRKGLAIMAISAVDIALWDLLGKVRNEPVYHLLGGRVHEGVPVYVTGNDVAWHRELGFTRYKLAIPYGPADGWQGCKGNVAMVEAAREAAGPDADIMLDCYMAWDVEYTLQMADLLRPYRVRWMEECLLPDDYNGYAELTRRVEGTVIATGEHEYTRWGFHELLSRHCCHIIQPDLEWAGGITEMRRIAVLASAWNVPVIPHAGGLQPWAIHWMVTQPSVPLGEYVVALSREDGDALHPWYPCLRGVPQPDGGYIRPTDVPGLGVEPDPAWLEE